MIIILSLITIIIDYLLSYFIPSYFNNINCFYPMLTLTLIVFLYKKINNKDYLKLIFLIGFLYDLVFSYIFLFNSLIFLLFGKIIKKIDKYIRINFIVSLIIVIFDIFLYDLILFSIVYISKYSVVNLSDLFYKFKNSIILNILFFILLNIIFKNIKFFKKNKKSFTN